MQLHVDHFIARAAGGSDDRSNLVTSCQDCNLGKRTRNVEEAHWRRFVPKRLIEALSEAHFTAVQREMELDEIDALVSDSDLELWQAHWAEELYEEEIERQCRPLPREEN